MVMFLVCCMNVTAFGITSASAKINTEEKWIIGESYNIEITTTLDIQDIQVLIVAENGDGFSPDNQIIGENGVYIYNIVTPVVDPGDYYVKASMYDGKIDYTVVKDIEIKYSIKQRIRLIIGSIFAFFQE